MRAYFSQFGNINRLRLSRNRTTGASKHYAFIEFESASVAEIVASTMNNYLMFGHILKCRMVPEDQIHEKMWVGANKRFKRVPWARIEGKKLAMGMDRDRWRKRVETEKKRRKAKTEALKRFGYEFDMGDLKRVEDLSVEKSNSETENLKSTPLLITEKETDIVNVGSAGSFPSDSQKTMNKESNNKLNIDKKESKHTDEQLKTEQVAVSVPKPSKVVKHAKPLNEPNTDSLDPSLQKPRDLKRNIDEEVSQPAKKGRRSKGRGPKDEIDPPAEKAKKSRGQDVKAQVKILAEKSTKTKKRNMDDESLSGSKSVKKAKTRKAEELARKSREG